MYIEQVYSPGLSQSAYYVESEGESAIIDPARDVAPLMALIRSRKSVLKYVFETHIHSDFVSGHLDLSGKTGAQMIFGPGANAGYASLEAADGAAFAVGTVTLKVFHTPGHAQEAICILLLDERRNPHSVFTGDTLFAGEVGRTDLGESVRQNKEHMAGRMFDSIQSKLLSLPNYVVVYPGHGPGGLCGKSIGDKLHTTIGIEKQTNYALKTNDRSSFIRKVTESLPEPLPYFKTIAELNRKGYNSLESILERSLKPVAIPENADPGNTENVLVLDTRPDSEFESGFIPGSVHLGLDGNFECLAGSVLDPSVSLVIVAGAGKEREVITRLAGIGYERISGYLEGGIDRWKQDGGRPDFVRSVSATEFESRFSYGNATALDVRNRDECISGIVAGARLIPLSQLNREAGNIDRNKPCYIYCVSGYRSIVAASLLKKKGFEQVINVTGGMNEIRKTAVPLRQLSI